MLPKGYCLQIVVSEARRKRRQRVLELHRLARLQRNAEHRVVGAASRAGVVARQAALFVNPNGQERRHGLLEGALEELGRNDAVSDGCLDASGVHGADRIQNAREERAD